MKGHPKWTCTPPEPAPCGRQVRRTACAYWYQNRGEGEEMCHGTSKKGEWLTGSRKGEPAEWEEAKEKDGTDG